MNKIFIGLAVFIFFTAIGFNIYQYQKIKKLSVAAAPDAAANEMSEEAGKGMSKKGPAGQGTDMKDIRKLEERLEATEEELNKVSELLAEELARKNAFEAVQDQVQKSLASDPSFKESMKNMRLQTIDSDYALLYGHLDLTPEEREEFKNIVATWRVDHMDTVDLILAAQTDEEKEEARRQRELKREKYKEQFIELMGEEKFEMYNKFRMSTFDRNNIDRFNETLPAEKRLDNDTMFDLITRMSEERTELEKEYGFYDLVGFPSDNRSDRAESEAEMAEQVFQKYTEIGDEMMAPELAEQYKAYIDKERESYLSQIKIRSF